MDEELRALERAALRVGPRYAALVRPLERTTNEPEWERVTVVGFFGHEGCLLWQGRERFWLVPVHTVAALAELKAAMIYDMEARTFVPPIGFASVSVLYMHDLEVGWTPLTNREAELEEAEKTGRGNSDPYEPICRLRGRPAGFRGPMHEEIDRCRRKFVEARARVAGLPEGWPQQATASRS